MSAYSCVKVLTVFTSNHCIIVTINYYISHWFR